MSAPSLALKNKYCIRLTSVDVMGFKFHKNSFILLDKHTIWHLGLEEAGGWAWNYSFGVFRQTQKLRNIMCFFCSVCKQDPAFFFFSFISLFLLSLVSSFYCLWSIYYYCDTKWKVSKCCIRFLSKNPLGWQAIARRLGKNIIISAWLADY